MRHFAPLLGITFLFLVACQKKSRQDVTIVARPSTATSNTYYVSNKAPLQPSSFIKLPLGSIVPAGWVGKYLELQRQGLTGHLGEVSAWLEKENNAWLSKDGTGNHGWEEVPYWLKGYGALAYILEDSAMMRETAVWINAALESQRPDGFFGPTVFRQGDVPDLWGNMVMLWCIQAYYEHSRDERVLPFMTRYFAWQAAQPDSTLLEDFWENSRGGDNLYSIFWLYNRTGDKFLLDLAKKIHRNTANWEQENNLPNWHNVNIAQSFREPATYYLLTGDSTDLKATYRDFQIIRERYGQVPGGMFGADENAREGYTDPRQAVETCGMVEQMASDEMLIQITGDPFWVDHCEEVAFNTYPAAVMPDFRALRYLTAPNMVLSDHKDHSPGLQNNGPFLMMNPFSSRCCQHNHAQGWPYYAENLFAATPDNGLAALLYSAASVTAKVGTKGQMVTVAAITHYPFEEQIAFQIHTEEPVDFPFYFRMPGWCAQPQISVNDKKVLNEMKSAGYARIFRTWHDGDEVVLSLPMALHLTTWEQNKNSVSIAYGPITFSLKIDERGEKMDSKETAIGDSKWQQGVNTDEWPSCELYPDSPWNYALVLPAENPETAFEVVHKSWPEDDFPFKPDTVPLQLKAVGRRIPAWKIDQYGLAGLLPQSPVETEMPEESITLIPMGAARLRISAFPTVPAAP